MNANGAPERTRPDTLNAVTVNQAFGYFLVVVVPATEPLKGKPRLQQKRCTKIRRNC
jgi:hypothetical protein